MKSAENVLRKLLYNDSDEEFAEHFNTFCEEYRKFMKKIDTFDSQEKMWKSNLFRTGKVHEWHDNYSVNSTQILGWVACQVTSKILGVGNAERA